MRGEDAGRIGGMGRMESRGTKKPLAVVGSPDQEYEGWRKDVIEAVRNTGDERVNWTSSVSLGFVPEGSLSFVEEQSLSFLNSYT